MDRWGKKEREQGNGQKEEKSRLIRHICRHRMYDSGQMNLAGGITRVGTLPFKCEQGRCLTAQTLLELNVFFTVM